MVACPSGIRQVALEKNDSSNGGSSDRSISSSVSESIIAQLVSEELLISDSLISRCLHHRNNADSILTTFSEYHNHNPYVEHTNPDPPIFTIVLPVIRCHKHRKLEDPLGISEVKTMLADVCLAFLFIPLKMHESCLPSRSLYEQAQYIIHQWDQKCKTPGSMG